VLFKKNDSWHFQNLHMAMITLFRCATLEDWADVMYTNMFGCDKFGYSAFPQLCTSPEAWGAISTLYFVVFVLVGAMVLLNLFVGVITTNMELATEENKQYNELQNRVKAMQKRYAVSPYNILRTDIQCSKGLSKKTVRLYRTVFFMLDMDGGGTIGASELQVGLESVGQTPTLQEIKILLRTVDADDTGEIDFAEFVEFMVYPRVLYFLHSISVECSSILFLQVNQAEENQKAAEGAGAESESAALERLGSKRFTLGQLPSFEAKSPSTGKSPDVDVVLEE
jgi:hypothetical protein